MIVTCPSCSSKYRVEADALAKRGGRVRCATCSHVWTVEDEALTLTEPAEPTPEPTPEPEPEPAPSLQDKPHAAIRARAEARRRKARVAVEGAGWAGVAAALALVLAGAFVFRVDVVEVWPRAAGAYAAVGLSVNPYGFEVADLTARFEDDEGARALVVEGELRNVAGRERPAAPLRAIVLDADGALLAEWPIALETEVLPGDGAERFRTVLAAPPEGAARVDVLVGESETATDHAAGAHSSHPGNDAGPTGR